MSLVDLPSVQTVDPFWSATPYKEVIVVFLCVTRCVTVY